MEVVAHWRGISAAFGPEAAAGSSVALEIIAGF
jgi:hypothetical protein